MVTQSCNRTAKKVGFDPSAAPTMPRSSNISINRAAREYPTFSLWGLVVAEASHQYQKIRVYILLTYIEFLL